MDKAKLSSKQQQVVIPRRERGRPGLEPDDKVSPEPESFERALRGIARRLYPPDYLEKERQSWDDPKS